MRKKRQEEAIESWLKSNRNSIIYASPRFGKCKIGVEIIKKGGFKNVLIAYPNLPVRESWEKDLNKWGRPSATIVFTTNLSLNKALSQDEWDLIILDESHSLSEAQIDTIVEYKKNGKAQFLGLSGSLSENTQITLKQRFGMDICYEYSIEQAVKEGVISDYEIEIHTVPLDNKIVKEYTKKKTKRTEKQQFDHLSRTIDWMEKSDKVTFHMRLARMRLIQGSISKFQKTKKLLKGRTLVFCGTTAIADQIGCKSYHSKANEKSILDDFCQGTIDQLAVCKMLNMGVTISNLDNVILNYTDSNEENLIQKICRCLNYDYVGKTAKIIIVSSTEPVEIAWLKSALKSLNKDKISWI